MDKEFVLEIIRKYQAELTRNQINVDRMILYGSYAHGTPQEESDIDLVVISEDFEKMDYWERIRVLSRAVINVFSLIEPVGFTPKEWDEGKSLIYDFAKDGITIN